MKKPLPSIMQLSQSAANRLKQLNKAQPEKLLRISVKAKGCSGMSYDMQWVETVSAGDEVITQMDSTVLVDKKATLFLIGTTMDWEESGLSASFTFKNPNEKARCGCGESFNV